MKKFLILVTFIFLAMGIIAQERQGVLTLDVDNWFKLSQFTAGFQGQKEVVDETKADTLTYELPAFNCSLNVVSSAPTGSWKIGFVRAIQRNLSSIIWKNGVLNEILPIVPVNDGLGKPFPWTDIKDVKDLPKGKSVTLSHRYFLQGKVSWKAPQKDGTFAVTDDLTNLVREVHETLYLVAFEEGENKYVFLKEIEFQAGTALTVDCAQVLGKRVQASKPLLKFAEVAAGPTVRVPDARLITGPGLAESKQLWLNYELWN